MPFTQVLNGMKSLSPREVYELNLEFAKLRQELDEMRAAHMSQRALLIAGTAVGAGYNVTATDLGTTTANTAVPPKRFTAV